MAHRPVPVFRRLKLDWDVKQPTLKFAQRGNWLFPVIGAWSGSRTGKSKLLTLPALPTLAFISPRMCCAQRTNACAGNTLQYASLNVIMEV
jgi:hypothetical protein